MIANHSTEPNQPAAETKGRCLSRTFTFVQTLRIDPKKSVHRKKSSQSEEKKGGQIQGLDGGNSSKKVMVYYQSRAGRSPSETRSFLFPFLIHCQKLAASHFYLLLITSAKKKKKIEKDPV